MIAEMNASYVSLLTLMLQPPCPMLDDYKAGKFKFLTPEEVLAEPAFCAVRAAVEALRFRSNHASNYVSLRGNLPMDNAAMIASLKKCMQDRGLLKDERFRML